MRSVLFICIVALVITLVLTELPQFGNPGILLPPAANPPPNIGGHRGQAVAHGSGSSSKPGPPPARIDISEDLKKPKANQKASVPHLQHMTLDEIKAKYGEPGPKHTPAKPPNPHPGFKPSIQLPQTPAIPQK